ncbi:MAG TPA: OB-fold nucleic acid binding domain-containing protein, partial [Acidobacteriota bacterium]|nr:OB-fold nucleic acid binding domain-containing protein [Acidobacteriota bacterium]
MMESMGDLHRTCYCGEVAEHLVDSQVVVMGWVDRVRDLGNLVFIDLRDRTGIVQIVTNPEAAEALEKARQVRPEWVLAVEGPVVRRSPDTVNPDIPTGTVEVRACMLRVLNRSLTPPFPLNEQVPIAEEARLKYRYLDLRRRVMQQNMM